MLLAFLLTLTHTATANPFAKAATDSDGIEYLMDRSCSPCGWNDQLCCAAGSACYTDINNQAQCGAAAVTTAAVSGTWQVYTTTWVETDLQTLTSTYSSYGGVAPSTTVTTSYAATETASCQYSLGESPCGAICCASSQYCYTSGQCMAIGGGGSSGYYSSVATYETTSSYSAPLRPTSGAVTTATSTVSPTTTVPFETAVSTSGSAYPITQSTTSHKLSGGTIAGIVIGVLVGIAILCLLCFFCIIKAGIDGILGIFGLGKNRKRREERVIIDERYSRYGSAAGGASRRDTHSGWFGAGGGRPSRVADERKKKSSGVGGLAGVMAGLGGLALVLGLKRKNDRARTEKSDDTSTTVSSMTYTDSYTGTSDSEYP